MCATLPLSLVGTLILPAGSLQRMLGEAAGGRSKVKEKFGVLDISVGIQTEFTQHKT